jgi:hypothetical protein
MGDGLVRSVAVAAVVALPQRYGWGRQGTFEGAICWNGSLYCPSTPVGLFGLEPLVRGASEAETAAHDARSAELDRYRFSVLNADDADDADGHHRVLCPAVRARRSHPMSGGRPRAERSSTHGTQQRRRLTDLHEGDPFLIRAIEKSERSCYLAYWPSLYAVLPTDRPQSRNPEPFGLVLNLIFCGPRAAQLT